MTCGIQLTVFLDAGITGLSLLITPFLLQLTERYLLNDDDGKVCSCFPAFTNI